MSEGPEVQRIAREQHAVLAGARLLGVTTNLRKARAWLEAHPDAVHGQPIAAITACGKHILWRMDDGLWFHFHLLMFGKWESYPSDAAVPYDRTTRAQILTDRRLLALCNGQVFDVGYGDPYAQLPALAALGPDICAVPYDAATFRARLLAPAQHEREIGEVLLDQTIANGVGNYLKSEILFECRLDPWHRVADLTPRDVACLAETLPAIGARALADRGWTVTPEVRRLVEAGVLPGGRGRRHWVFRRTNQPCRLCGTPIRQRRQGPPPGRWTFWCPNCQAATAAATAAHPAA